MISGFLLESLDMKLALYFFRQYIPTFLFGIVLFSFVFILDKMFDLMDLILNKGVQIVTVLKLMALFIPTAFPLALPMAVLLGCMVTFGRMSEENELTAVRAAGISLLKALWIIPVFAILLSTALVPFNNRVAPWINRAFRSIYETIIHADPLINITEKNFFSIKNIKILAHSIDPETKQMRDLFVYQLPKGGKPAERIFARSGVVTADDTSFQLSLQAGQLQRFDALFPNRLAHATFGEYTITIPLNIEKAKQSTRFRNIPSPELKKMIKSQKQKGIKTSALEAENSLRFAMAFAPFCLVMIGIPLATSIKRGGRAFNIGISLIVIFTYYLLLIFGLTMAEKNILPAHPALWIANSLCLILGLTLFRRLLKQ